MQAVLFGEAMVALIPTSPEPLEKSTAFVSALAGAEANVAVHLAALGWSVRFAGRVGDDPFGHRILSELVRAGVSVDLVEVARGETTGVYFRDRDTESPRVAYYRTGSAASRLRPTAPLLSAVVDADLVHLTGITPMLSDASFETTMAVVDRAREHGVTMSFDLNFRPALGTWERFAEIQRGVGSRSQIVFLSPDEVRALDGEAQDLEKAAERLLRASSDIEEIVVRDRRAATVLARDRLVHVPGIRGIEPVDVAGAGDAFAAGYLAARSWGYNDRDRLRAAHLLGAQACRTVADSGGTVREEVLRSFLEEEGD
jgi:2-dehydro-3-deoxygluconokinase